MPADGRSPRRTARSRTGRRSPSRSRTRPSAIRRPASRAPTSSTRSRSRAASRGSSRVYQCQDADAGRARPQRAHDGSEGARASTIRAGVRVRRRRSSPVINAVERRRPHRADDERLRRAPSRATRRALAPHNLLLEHGGAATRSGEGARGRRTSTPLFTYRPRRRRPRQARLVGPRPVLDYSDVTWNWSATTPAVAALATDDAPMTARTATQISADERRDPAGRKVTRARSSTCTAYHSPEVDGDRHRQGVRAAGRQGDRGHLEPAGARRRHRCSDQDAARSIPLAPGNTWVELVPKGTRPTVTK